jgi:two-component system, OmpR family, phosphate regulon response regulator OmpR
MNHESAYDRHGKRISIVAVEDDEFFGHVLEFQLRSHGYNVKVCQNETALMEHLRTHAAPDLFIIDYCLGPDMPTGLELCRRVISYCSRPVVMLTARDDVNTVVSCLSAGAAQYIVKPCDVRELVARIQTTMRLNQSDVSPVAKPLRVNIDENIALYWDEECLKNNQGDTVTLTQKEMAILELFLNEKNRSIDRQSAFYVLYGYEMDPSNRSIDVLVSRIRKKLQVLDKRYQIKNVRGQGYALFRKVARELKDATLTPDIHYG